VTTRWPSAEVLGGFGVRGEAARLPGGQGQTWRVGGVVLKPAGLPEEAVWTADILSTMETSGRFRVAKPLRAGDGGWLVSGWQAWRAVTGEPDPRRWHDVLAVGQAFHQALAGLPRPGFLDVRDDPWSYAERVAWEVLPVDGEGAMARLLAELAAARRPVASPAQPVHGDLLGNVLFAGGLPPAVIDWSVYFRPPSWALAVAVVDALTWHGAPPTLIRRVESEDWHQMLVRALMFRIATNEGCRRRGLPVREQANQYQHVIDLVLALT
jgi:uncharacterized protein (TIGR02569 family)